MISESNVRDLLARWEEARERGEEPSPESLTDDAEEREELKHRIEGIKSFQKFRQVIPPTLNPPKFPQIPGYEILGELGRGGMGVVYQAAQKVNNRQRIVAIKTIRGQFASDPEYLRRFRFEAEALVSLEHVNIVRVYGVGDQDGTAYFVMQYIDGETIDRLKFRDTTSGIENQRQIASLFVKVANAIDYAHQNGIIHRDVKPGNILLAKDGTPYVTDFGLATSLQAESIQTPTGLIVGTPSYMAPEVASGQEKGTIKSDVYGIGAVLYEILTGRPPFRGNDLVQTLLLITEGKLARPRSVNPKIDADLEIICLKCLREKETRYNSANELAHDLQNWLDGKPISAREFSLSERFWRVCKRNPGLVGLTAALVATILTAILLIGWQIHKTEIAAIKAIGETKLKEQALLAKNRSELLFDFMMISEIYTKGAKKEAMEEGREILNKINALNIETPTHNPTRLLLVMVYRALGMMVIQDQMKDGVNTELESLMALLQRRPISESSRASYELALSHYDKAAAIHELIKQESKEIPDLVRNSISELQFFRAHALGLLHRFTESLQAVDQAIEWNTVAESVSELEAFRKRQLDAAAMYELPEILKSRPTPRVHVADMKRAAYLAESKGVIPEAIYNAACIFSLAATDMTVTSEDRERRAIQAVKYLSKINDRKYFGSRKKQKEILEDPDLVSLRNREDFKELLEKIIKK